MTVRVNITVSEKIKKYFEEQSQETGIPQSSLMCMALAEYIDNKKIMKEMCNMQSYLQKIENLSKIKEENKNDNDNR